MPAALVVAGFIAILAAGVGFAIRGGILNVIGAGNSASMGARSWHDHRRRANWLPGLVILIGGLLADKLGYANWSCLVFALSAVVTFAATGAFGSGDPAGKRGL